MPPPGETRFHANELEFQFANTVTPQQVQEIAQRFGLTIVSSEPIGILGRTVYTFRIAPGRSVRQVIREIEFEQDRGGRAAGVRLQYKPGPRAERSRA